MSTTIKVVSPSGNEKVFIRLQGLDKAIRGGIRRGWFSLGRDLKSEANREILRRPKGGRVYIVRSRTGAKRRHVASAPGETHANLGGDLRRSLSWKVKGSESMEFGYGVSTVGKEAPVYARAIEFGNPPHLEARPSLENAIDATQREAEQNFQREITRELKK